MMQEKWEMGGRKEGRRGMEHRRELGCRKTKRLEEKGRKEERRKGESAVGSRKGIEVEWKNEKGERQPE